MVKDSGALPGSRADASSPQAVSTKGFDPARVAVAEFAQPLISIERQDRDGMITGDRYIWVRHAHRPQGDALLVTVHYNYAYHDNSTIDGIAGRVASALGYAPAIATEAQRAATTEIGAVHEGAGRRHRPNTVTVAQGEEEI